MPVTTGFLKRSPALVTRVSGHSLRRAPWVYYVGLTVLLFWISRNITFRRSLQILRPGNIWAGPRQLDPSQDQTPFAHEPIGLGTLRDVREEKFYEGGILTLTSTDGLARSRRPVVYDPYPDYDSPAWRSSFTGRFQVCKGPDSRDLDRASPKDMMSVYPGIQKDFPFPTIGSYEALGLDSWVCADRTSRLGVYGHGRGEPGDLQHPGEVNYNEVDWKSLQQQCLQRNEGRFKATRTQLRLSQGPETLSNSAPSQRDPVRRRDNLDNSPPPTPQPRQRTAILLRAWHDMEWTANLKQYVRSLIMELSLHTGAEYEVFVLLHVKDSKVVIDWEDATALQRLTDFFVPTEFRNIAILFNDQILEVRYPKVDNHSPVYQYWQPVQLFSQVHPEFDYIWQLEMDSRLTGHAYHFLDRVQTFARQQPRKYLWERNSYLYIPGAHGGWNQFMQMVDGLMRGKQSVWGPAPARQITPVGPKVPVRSPAQDNYQWGVGEEADLITLLPIFDPTHTQWTFPDTMWNLSRDTPRRASPVVMGRISRALINQMHEAQIDSGIGLASEMTAPTFALWHGMKAVHVPHPIYTDGKWTPKELGRILNPGVPEKVNGGSDSIWNWDHKWDHILYRMSYMFTAQTAEDFFRRWLGYKVGDSQYTDGTYHQDPAGRNWFDNGYLREDLYGNLCFPPMLLHPVKNTGQEKGQGTPIPL